MTPQKIFIQLGRYGDIINILPLVKREYDKTGIKPLLQVAEEFASLLEGVTYCEPLIYYGSFKEADKAMFEAAKISMNIVLCQIYGNGIRTREITTSFVRESWLQAGADVPWGTLALEFDNRNLAREERLYDAYVPEAERKKKLVLIALDGLSSPFCHKRRLKEILRIGLDDFSHFILDLGRVKAERIYDLLGLMDRAACLVSIDTGILHLAHGSTVPVVSLITSRPSRWHGSAWRHNHVARFYYDEFPMVRNEVVYAISKVTKKVRQPRIVHTWADFRNDERDEDTKRRVCFAEKTWEHEYRTGLWHIAETKQTEVQRSALTVGDEKTVPFLRDVIANGMRYAGMSFDIIAVTNADVSFLPGITGLILDACRRYGAAFTHRWDFERLDKPLLNEAEIKCGKWYPGSDAFFFTVEWWHEHGPELPDMIMGREKNDEVFRQMIKRFGGVEIPACIYHEKHASYWERPENFEKNAGNNHNRILAQSWFEKTHYTPNDWKWWPAVEGEWQFSIDRHAG